MRRALMATAVATVMVTGMLAAPAVAAGVPRRSPDKLSCAIPGATVDSRRQVSASASLIGADDVPQQERWLADPATQDLNRRIQDESASLLGQAPRGKERIADQLRRGLVGYAADNTTQTLNVVVTPGTAEKYALAGRLDATLWSVARVSAYSPKVAVVTACHSAESLIAADNLIFGRAWHPDAAKASFNYGLDPADSTFHVSFDARYPAAAQALRRALGDRVAVQLGSYRIPTGRLDDGEPHYGGAGIRVGSGSTSNNTCTSGFMVRRNSDGRKGMAAAAHCFENNQSIYSGPQFYGVTADENVNNYDVIGIYSTTETYAPVIHVDPCSPCTRTVVNDITPLPNSYVCLSGMVTKAICSVKVISTGNGTCLPEGCVTGVIWAERWDRTIVKPGDSGGPMYTRVGSTGATINGMIIGQDAVWGPNRVLAESASSVQDGLQATIVYG